MIRPGDNPGENAAVGRGDRIAPPPPASLRGRVLYADDPGGTVPVSVTGSRCQLDCAHCGAHYLKAMSSLEAAKKKSAESFLISGGSDSQGRVPVLEHAGQIEHLGREAGLNVHTGLVLDPREAERLGQLASVVSFDFVGSDETIRDVLGLSHTVGDYLVSYRLLARHAAVYPHICVGLHGGRLRGEHRAVEILAGESPPALVLLVFRPTRGSRLESCAPPPVGEVADFLRWSRQTLPDIPIVLGCMRPGGNYRRDIDRQAVLAGLDGIVKPHPAALDLAREVGRPIRPGGQCCSLEMARRLASKGEEGERE